MGQNWRPELARGQKRPARARSGPKKVSPNPTRARKKVARPSPTTYILDGVLKKNSGVTLLTNDALLPLI